LRCSETWVAAIVLEVIPVPIPAVMSPEASRLVIAETLSETWVPASRTTRLSLEPPRAWMPPALLISSTASWAPSFCISPVSA
jgi:hypothetical protein